MSGVAGVASRRVLSAGATLLFGSGLALYQLTSLVLGPAGSRQLELSLTIPAVEVQDLSEPLASNVKVVVGTRATPAAPAPAVTRVFVSARASATPTTKDPGPITTTDYHDPDERSPGLARRR